MNFQVGDAVWWLNSDTDKNGRHIDEAATVTKITEHHAYTGYTIIADNGRWSAYVGASELEKR
jgi:hypothetical protein